MNGRFLLLWVTLSATLLSFGWPGLRVNARSFPQTPPIVEKVEPPNWWAGHSVNPVRLMVRGTNLQKATVTAPTGLAASRVSVNASGTYLFVDVTIARNIRPGSYPLRITTNVGTTTVPFSVEAPLPRIGNFQGFSPDDVIYLIMPDRFCDGDPTNNNTAKSPGMYDTARTRSYQGGDFAGIRKKLPYLKELGVTAIWMTPIYDNADIAHPTLVYDGQHSIDYHGYGAVDYYGVEEHLGTLADLRAMIQEAHRLGIKVIQDQVANHVGPLHPWVTDSPTPTWFNGTAKDHLACDWQVTNLINPHATPETMQATLSGWFAGILPDMNQDDPEASRYLIQNALWWVGVSGFDAIRQDTLPYAPRRFWRDWTAALKREYTKLTLLGEVNIENPVVVSFFQGGAARFDGVNTGVDTLFDYPLYGAMRRVFAEGQSVRELANVLAHDTLYPNPDVLVPFVDCHDTRRFLNLSATVDTNALKLAYTFLITTRGTPLLYYGDEIALRGGEDPDNRRPFPGGFPGNPRDAFTPAGRTPEEESVYRHVQRLLTLRTKTPALRRGRQTDLLVTERQYVYARTTPAGETAIIALNMDTKEVSVTVPLGKLLLKDGTRLTDALNDDTVVTSGKAVRIQSGILNLKIPARSTQVFLP